MAADFLRGELGPERAAAWWHEVGRNETVPALAAAFANAATRAAGREPQNLLEDPRFEQIGRSLAPDEFAISDEIPLDIDQALRLGVRQWFPERAPYRCVLSPDQPRAGRYALMLEHCYRARYSVSAKTEPGERYRVGLWFRRNEGQAGYRFAVDARMADGTFQTVATAPIADESDRWRQVVTEVVAPPGSTGLSLRLYIDRQAADARCWIDDVLIAH
jgi:hypothetical protein